ncbi:MAG: OmpH family outer membrane protein [Pseudomonadota bacterium]
MSKKIITVSVITGLALLTWVLAVYLPSATAAAPEIKIGVFDMQKALDESKLGKASKANLLAKFQKLQKELSDEEAQLKTLKTQLDQQAPMLSPTARTEKEKELQRRIRDLQDKARDYSDQMKRDDFEQFKPLYQGLLDIAKDIGKAKGFTVILEAKKGLLIYYQDSLDITDEVIQRFDAGK